MSIASCFLKPERLIFRMQHGSHLYGTNTPESDYDYKQVYLPSGRDILLQTVKEARAEGPEKGADEKNQPGDIDTQSFSVGKMMKMVMGGDIIGCELIFAPPQNVIFTTPVYDMILAHKHAFLSRKVDGYVGYCKTQANKYGIRGSRISSVRGLLDKLKEIGNPNDRVRDHWVPLAEYCDTAEHCSTLQIQNGALGTPMWHLECCSKKVPETIMVKDAIRIFQLYFDNYGHRALLAEKNEGIDWKAMSHAVRVGEQAIELLDTGHIEFPRHNAAELLAIKRGNVPYREVGEYLEELLIDVETASANSSLPEEPNAYAAEELLLELHRMMV